jgi:hypothetical protein
MSQSKLFLTAAAIAILMAVPAYSNDDHSVPDPQFAPGAAASDVTQDNIQDTICVPGFTKPPRRPPNKYTHDLKEAALNDPARGYADKNMADYEEDHLIPLTIGGAPKDPKNLWPEAYDAGNWGARKKDKLEVKLNKLICAGVITLQKGQDDIAHDWTAVYDHYMDMEVPQDTADQDDQ